MLCLGRACAALLVMVAIPTAPATFAGVPELELGAESFSNWTTATTLNQDDVLGLGEYEGLLRALLNAKHSVGAARGVFRGYVEHSLAAAEPRTRWRARQAYLQYGWGSGLSLRLGKQRIAWGSGFAWNPTNRVEPPKNPLNTSLEQEGALAVRMDWVPASWVGVILLAARSEAAASDLPFDAPAERRRAAAVRARFLAKDTDLALVLSGGKGHPSLVGLDVGRDILGRVSAHAEAALYRGAELAPAREDELFLRLASGLLWTSGESALSAEYFFNGEGYTDRQLAAYLASLDAAYGRASDPTLPPAAREQALLAYLGAATRPYGAGLGLRRHYLQAAWTRSPAGGRWSVAARGVLGLSDGGVALTPGVGFAPRGNVTLGVDAILILGPTDSEYRLAPVKGALQARLKVLF
jgi:hypothetical protein